MFGLKNDEIFTCLLLIIVGYCIAKMFSRSCEGFSVGGVRDGFPLCPSNNVDACDLHYSNCDNLYTHTIGNESDYSVHTCKKGGLFNGYRCISSGNKCVFPENHNCQEDADCESSVCENGKCASTPPPPPPLPSCQSGEEYCRGGDGITEPGCYPICRNGKERAVDCKCWPNCCFSNPDKCSGGPYICDSCKDNNDCFDKTTCVNGQCVKV